MITSVELENEIDSLQVSADALNNFMRRVANALKAALSERGVVFHAVNDDTTFAVRENCHGCGVDFTFAAGRWTWKVRDGLMMLRREVVEESSQVFVSLTTLLDSDLPKMAAEWAQMIAARSTEIAFQNMYEPRAVTLAKSYNDLEVAIRLVQTWDAAYSEEIIRLDCGFKKLDA